MLSQQQGNRKAFASMLEATEFCAMLAIWKGRETQRRRFGYSFRVMQKDGEWGGISFAECQTGYIVACLRAMFDRK